MHFILCNLRSCSFKHLLFTHALISYAASVGLTVVNLNVIIIFSFVHLSDTIGVSPLALIFSGIMLTCALTSTFVQNWPLLLWVSLSAVILLSLFVHVVGINYDNLLWAVVAFAASPFQVWGSSSVCGICHKKSADFCLQLCFACFSLGFCNSLCDLCLSCLPKMTKMSHQIY